MLGWLKPMLPKFALYALMVIVSAPVGAFVHGGNKAAMLPLFVLLYVTLATSSVL